MAIKIGVHTGPQDLSMEELLRLWKRADEAGFHWASVWDHFYANPLVDRENPCFEGVAAMAALAASTKRMRVGCLVFCALFRSPGLLAKAAVTIDHLSRGRAEIGIGAGWFQEEFDDFGYTFAPLGRRLDQLEEALQIVRSLFRDEETNFEGEFYRVSNAVCSPKPFNPKLRIWVGGRGPKRTPQLAARYGDGFNMPYLSPRDVKARLGTLEEQCSRVGRDPAEIETSVNVGFYLGVDRGAIPGHIAEGSLVGGTREAVDRIGEYVDTGIEGLNIAFRPPIDWQALESFVEEVLPVFHPEPPEPGAD